MAPRLVGQQVQHWGGAAHRDVALGELVGQQVPHSSSTSRLRATLGLLELAQHHVQSLSVR
jgi:hypothetical protein